MSCEIRQIANSLELNKLKEWPVEKGDRNFDNWLQECLISFSPTGEILVVAKGTNLAILTSKWDATLPGDIKMKYSITWKGNPCTKSGDITSVLCLPLVSHGQSASGADWTCIAVGFSSGTIKFYTENMHQLMSEMLHAEPIQKIKCNSFKTLKQQGLSSGSDQDSHELIYILYKSVICIINGFSLFQTLRGCRNRLARQSASLQAMGLEESLPMDFKKYSFTDQDAITDACFIGQTSTNIFDHLVTASLAGGFDCYYKPSPPQASLIVATGRKPFLGFHYTKEGGITRFTDVAMAVASKIRESVASSLPGLFGFGSKSTPEQEKMKVSQEPAEQLGCRFGLCDLWRHGNSIITSPDGKLSAITDTLGRILLIENSSGIARRLWKGYREAQCGFLDVEEDVEKSRRRREKHRSGASVAVARRALFIIIYAPRKGLIEIFSVHYGRCIASFKVSKNGRLIYTPYGLLGFNSPPKKGMNVSQYPVAFLSEDGVKEVIVPFHCGLRNDNVDKARDLHLLKKMKAFLKEDPREDEKYLDEIKSFAKDLKTDEIKFQIIDMLILNKQINAQIFMAVLNVFTEDLKTKDDGENSKSFILLVEALEKVIDLYIFLKDLNGQPPNYEAVVDSAGDESSLSDVLLLSPKELTSILNVVNSIKELESGRDRVAKVTFLDRLENGLSQFLTCFDFNNYTNSAAKAGDKNELYLNFKTDLNEERMRWLGEFLFSGVFYSNEWMNDWRSFVSDSKLDRISLMKCLLSYWLSKNVMDNLSCEVTSLTELLKVICSLVDPECVSVEYNSESPWWKTIRNFLKTRRSSLAGMLAGVACRSETMRVEQLKELTQTHLGKKLHGEEKTRNEESQDNSSQMNEWENVSQDTWQWDILITKLEDVAALNAILNMNLKNDKPHRPQLHFDFENLSLNSILAKGDGYISELVAKWLTQFGLTAATLVDRRDVEFQTKKISPDKTSPESDASQNGSVVEEVDVAKRVEENDTIPIIKDYFTILKHKFPYSLTSSTILSNISWEYMVHWYRNADNLSYLESAIHYLQNIPSANVKYGLCYLSWTTYVMHKFSAVAKLMNKFGKIPKEKFCAQEVNLTSLQVSAFLKLSTDLLNIMLETGISEGNEFPANDEGIWQNEPKANVPSLVTVALSQPKLNDDLVLLHYQLSTSLHMISELNFKFPRPFACLFDNVAQSAFFTDLSKNSQLSGHSSNAILTLSRKEFLCKVIAGAVQTIEVVENIPAFPVAELTDYVPRTCMSVEKATKWMSSCFDLARMWDIPLDDLRRNHVCELYSCGYDRLAEEVISAVNDSSHLASQLLVISGRRLKLFIHGSSGYSEKISALSPNLSKWLECLECDSLKAQNVELSDLETILSYILKWQPKKAEERQLALAMAESIPALINGNSQ